MSGAKTQVGQGTGFGGNPTWGVGVSPLERKKINQGSIGGVAKQGLPLTRSSEGQSWECGKVRRPLCTGDYTGTRE